MPILTELATMTEIAQGTSMARFGHGELRIMHGRDARFQQYDKKLADELWKIADESPCLVCMPHTRGKRGWEWEVFLETYNVAKEGKWYGSSFVTREDEAEWPDGYRSLVRSVLNDAKMAYAPKINAYSAIEQLEDGLIGRKAVGLSCGPAGTVLADRLARQGVWAVDLGNIEQFM